MFECESTCSPPPTNSIQLTFGGLFPSKIVNSLLHLPQMTCWMGQKHTVQCSALLKITLLYRIWFSSWVYPKYLIFKYLVTIYHASITSPTPITKQHWSHFWQAMHDINVTFSEYKKPIHNSTNSRLDKTNYLNTLGWGGGSGCPDDVSEGIGLECCWWCWDDWSTLLSLSGSWSGSLYKPSSASSTTGGIGRSRIPGRRRGDSLREWSLEPWKRILFNGFQCLIQENKHRVHYRDAS